MSARKFVRNLSKIVEILPSNRFESHSQSANGLQRPFGVKNDKYGPCHGADFYKNDTLSRSRNPENDTLFSGTSPYGKIYEYPPPGTESVAAFVQLCLGTGHSTNGYMEIRLAPSLFRGESA